MTFPDTWKRREIPFASLVAFEATARLGKLSRAADELNLTQSAISQRVLKLEAHVGQRLFLRHGHGVKLTSAGELLLATTRDTLQHLQAGLDRIAPYGNKASLLLACPADVAHGWLMPRLGRLRAVHDGLEVWLMPEREITAIDRIDVDLVISRRPLAWLPRVLAADAITRRTAIALLQVPPAPRERLWLMRSRLTPRTPLANNAFEWLLTEAATAS